MQLFPRGRKAWIRVLIVWGALGGFMFGTGCCWMSMPGRSHAGPLPALAPEEETLRDRLRGHVEKLARDIGERNHLHVEGLEKAARYVEKSFRDLGYAVAAQPYEVKGRIVRNIEVEKPGTTSPAEILIVGGHYDSVIGSPGANDNATGAAGAIEVSRLLKDKPLARTVRFVAFVNEEPPWFQTDAMGSRVYARRCKERKENVVGMISLETIGHFSDAPKSQQYPFPFSLFYPGTGNFIGFVGNVSSGSLVRRAIKSFRARTQFPSEGVAAPGWITGIGWSDQWSFWEEGYPAFMLTDTAPFRYAHYHLDTDTPDRVDFDRCARVVAGVARVVEELAASDK